MGRNILMGLALTMPNNVRTQNCILYSHQQQKHFHYICTYSPPPYPPTSPSSPPPSPPSPSSPHSSNQPELSEKDSQPEKVYPQIGEMCLKEIKWVRYKVYLYSLFILRTFTCIHTISYFFLYFYLYSYCSDQNHVLSHLPLPSHPG